MRHCFLSTFTYNLANGFYFLINLAHINIIRLEKVILEASCYFLRSWEVAKNRAADFHIKQEANFLLAILVLTNLVSMKIRSMQWSWGSFRTSVLMDHSKWAWESNSCCSYVRQVSYCCTIILASLAEQLNNKKLFV